MRQRVAVVAAVVIALGVLLLAFAVIANHQQQVVGPPRTSTTAPGATTTPGGGAPFEVIRPFSPDVAWNRPVSDFGPSRKYAAYADRFWKYASFQGWDDPSKRGRFFVEFRSYSAPIYDARVASGTKRAFVAGFGYPPYEGYNAELPWDDSFRPADGNDGVVILVDPDSGRSWYLWNLQSNGSSCLTLPNLAAGFSVFDDLCAGMVSPLRNEDGSVADYRTWNSVLPERGMGVPKLAMITTPYEVRAGKIEHALEMTIFSTMFGPACTADEMDTDAMGSTCGFYLPPATRIEWKNGPTTGCGQNNQPNGVEYRRKTVPEGMRFALDISDADIDAWLDDRGYTEPLRSTARVFAVALRDYGFIVAETGCSGTAIQVDGMVNPDARAIWESLGVADTRESGNLLDGLVTRERIYVVAPPEPAPSEKEPAPGRGS